MERAYLRQEKIEHAHENINLVRHLEKRLVEILNPHEKLYKTPVRRELIHRKTIYTGMDQTQTQGEKSLNNCITLSNGHCYEHGCPMFPLVHCSCLAFLKQPHFTRSLSDSYFGPCSALTALESPDHHSRIRKTAFPDLFRAEESMRDTTHSLQRSEKEKKKVVGGGSGKE